ncbi:unnamed protein product [Nesidiocoris tenuis]|uniref:N-end rule aminoacyl transferase C-terminal domain-containing protein n=1 Tax=Nesidiocoris tenuis TaxID=355587 RepID=A0A6H5GR18_9HEMI|nr:unnamed protein product [Nesidiocoris tenuis]
MNYSVVDYLSISKDGDCGYCKSSETSISHGVGADCTKPPRKKSKLLRLERKIEKMRNAGIVFTPSKNVTTPEKTLEDFVRENDAAYPRKLELELVPSCSDEKILQECYNLYKKYQMSVHKDEESELTFSSFSNFLVVSPLQPYKDAETPDCGYGSFHQLYRLDGKLIAVGVVDILPRCVSSVYFFYDPDYSYLSLGTYGSLRELHLTRSLARQSPQLNQYYLGFYIHTCPKMRYKGRLQPSYLLCPEAYTWHPISSCLSKLDSSKYSRLNDDKNVKSAEDDVDLDKTKHEVSPTKLYMLREYALLVGKTCASRMFLRW